MNILKRPKPADGSSLLFSNRGIASIIVPLMIQQVLTVAVGAVDTVMVAYAGEAAVSGVSLVNTLDVLLVMFFSSLVTGGAVVVAQTLGRKNMDDARSAAKQLLYVATAALVAAMGVVGSLSWEGPVSLLIILPLMVNTVFLSLENPTLLRKSVVFTSSGILVYNIFVASGGGIISESISISSSIVAIIRYRKSSSSKTIAISEVK